MSIRFGLAALAMLPTLVAVSTADAQQATPVDLWVPVVEEFASMDRDELETVFIEVLAGAEGPGHIVGLRGIEAALNRRGFRVAGCLDGRDVACASPIAAVASTLGATRVIVASGRERGQVLHLDVYDVALGTRTQYEVRGPDVREAVFTAVAALTDATAELTVTSEPEGATLLLGGRVIGTTPYSGPITIGAYDLELRLEGYYDYGTPIELRAGDVRAETATLQRRYALVVIDVDAPDAQISVGSQPETYRSQDAIRLDPGWHEVTVSAPGYDSDTRTIDLHAGEERSYRVVLIESQETVSRRKMDTILARPLTLQVGAVGDSSRTSWNNARVSIDDERERVRCAVDIDSIAGPCLNNTPVGHLGIDVDVIYDWQFFELQLVGVGVRRTRLRGERTDFAIRDSREVVEARQGREIRLRLPSPGVRWLMGPHLSAALRTGPAIAFQRVEATVARTGESTRMRRTDWIWETNVTGRYHPSTTIFVFGEANIGFVLDHAATRARLGVSAGLGFHFGDPSGVQRKIEERRSRRDQPVPETPSEL